MPLQVIQKNFIHNYCRTCHSFQGSSIDDAITIFDHKFAYANKKWLYTAVTRATDLKKVFFYEYDEGKENEREAEQYFARKVERYRQQDKKAKRLFDEASYITKEWLLGCLGKSCGSCGDCLTYNKAHGKVECNLTAQRLNNAAAHHLDNIVPYCTYCNAYMSNREN